MCTRLGDDAWTQVYKDYFGLLNEMEDSREKSKIRNSSSFTDMSYSYNN